MEQAPHFDGDRDRSYRRLREHVAVWFLGLAGTRRMFEALLGRRRRSSFQELFEGDKIDRSAFVDLVKRGSSGEHQGTKLTRHEARARKHWVVPEDLEQVLHKDPHGLSQLGEPSPTPARRSTSEWIADAKQEETRKRRIAQALEKMREPGGEAPRSALGGRLTRRQLTQFDTRHTLPRNSAR